MWEEGGSRKRQSPTAQEARGHWEGRMVRTPQDPAGAGATVSCPHGTG